MHWIQLAMAILMEVLGTGLLKASGDTNTRWPVLGVAVSYGIAFYLLFLTLRVMAVGVVYALWSGLGTALTAVAAWVVFRQSLNTAAIIGIAIVVGGVIVMQLGSTVH